MPVTPCEVAPNTVRANTAGRRYPRQTRKAPKGAGPTPRWAWPRLADHISRDGRTRVFGDRRMQGGQATWNCN